MFMKGGYSFDDYEGLVKEKKADIDEFINTFVPALEEYRANYNGKGSAGGKKRAQIAHDILNKFFDGDPNGEYAVNDTGKPLGDLLLNKTKTEIGDDAYNALSAEQKLNTADLQQIILESTGPAVLLIEQALALATDTSSDSWLQRVDGLRRGACRAHRGVRSRGRGADPRSLRGADSSCRSLRGLFKNPRLRVDRSARGDTLV